MIFLNSGFGAKSHIYKLMVLETVLKGIITLVGLVICILVLQQGGRTDGISGMLNTTSNLNLFAKTKLRGSDVIINRIIATCLVVFVALIITLKHI